PISLTDMVLWSLQIHRIGRKDLVDLIGLFLGHDVKRAANGDREAIDAGHIADLLADDWGFWYESTQNLAKSRQLLGNFVAEGKVPRISLGESRIGSESSRPRSSPFQKGGHGRNAPGSARRNHGSARSRKSSAERSF